MMPKKILDLRKYKGLPNWLVFSDDDKILRPYSSWDIINNSRDIVDTNMYRRHDVVFSSSQVRERFYYAIKNAECVKCHYSMLTAPSVIDILDVIEPDKYLLCLLGAPRGVYDYVLDIHEVAGVYQIISGLGQEVYGYLTEALTYVRR